eukprot:TRINITY_DN18884_c1_g3_i2.p1 TRINITY_DN18884_c1_g3~~TRINITY_DN18884_c1_g3_i2.p1  ORF type:complete len:180 (+),score=37.76 TRINITY_DN18884_c1_g3_i2:3-542(+)
MAALREQLARREEERRRSLAGGLAVDGGAAGAQVAAPPPLPPQQRKEHVYGEVIEWRPQKRCGQVLAEDGTLITIHKDILRGGKERLRRGTKLSALVLHEAGRNPRVLQVIDYTPPEAAAAGPRGRPAASQLPRPLPSPTPLSPLLGEEAPVPGGAAYAAGGCAAAVAAPVGACPPPAL